MEFNPELFVTGYLVTGCLFGLLTFLLDEGSTTVGHLVICIVVGTLLGYLTVIAYLIIIVSVGLVGLFKMDVFQKRIKK